MSDETQAACASASDQVLAPRISLHTSNTCYIRQRAIPAILGTRAILAILGTRATSFISGIGKNNNMNSAQHRHQCYVTPSSLPRPWRARGQHGAPAIAGIRYCLSAYARAAARTSALCDCCATAIALQTCAPQQAGGSRGPSRRQLIGKRPAGSGAL